MYLPPQPPQGPPQQPPTPQPPNAIAATAGNPNTFLVALLLLVGWVLFVGPPKPSAVPVAPASQEVP